MTEQNNHLEGLDMERLFTDTQFDAVITVAGDVDVTAPMVTKIVAQVTDGDEYVLHGYSSLEQGKVRLGFLTKENAKIASEKLKQSCRNSLAGALKLDKPKKKKVR